MTSYDVIYQRFLTKIEDVDLAKMETTDRAAMIEEWFASALSLIDADMLKMDHDLTRRDDTEGCFTDDLSSAEVEVIALYMVVAWYEPKVNSLDHTLLFMGSKDEKFTNQKDHWKATRDIQESYRKRARKYFRNHSSRKNSYIGNVEEEV